MNARGADLKDGDRAGLKPGPYSDYLESLKNKRVVFLERRRKANQKIPRSVRPLYKTTIVVWTQESPISMNLEELAEEARKGNSLFAYASSEYVAKPELDPFWVGDIHEDHQPQGGWYIWLNNVNVAGPFDSEEEARKTVENRQLGTWQLDIGWNVDTFLSLPIEAFVVKFSQ